MTEPPSSEDFESPNALPSGDERKVGFGWRVLYGLPLGVGGFFLRMLIPIVLVIILAFLAQRVISH
jgi:hypothetical protein